MDLHELGRRVAAEIDSYEYVYPDGMIGEPLSAEFVQGQLEEMRNALVAPYWAKVTLRDTVEQICSTSPLIRCCAVVADDADGTLLAYDPVPNHFLLVRRCADGLESYGVDGDAVGCFIAR